MPKTLRQAEVEGYPLIEEDNQVLAKIAGRPGVYLDMDFQLGDIQFLNNRIIFHARTNYTDDTDPNLKRLLLRLWLMMPDWPERAKDMNFIANTDRASGGFIRKKCCGGVTRRFS